MAIVAGLLGFSGIAGTATNIAWILFVVGLVLALVFMITGRRGKIWPRRNHELHHTFATGEFGH